MRKKLKFLPVLLVCLLAVLVVWSQIGSTPQVHGVTLWWNGPAIGVGADGFNLYSQLPGAPGFIRLNASPITQTLATCPALPGLTSPCFTFTDTTAPNDGSVVNYEVLTTLGGIESIPDGPIGVTTKKLPGSATGLGGASK
jgi:hypothetical protein